MIREDGADLVDSHLPTLWWEKKDKSPLVGLVDALQPLVEKAPARIFLLALFLDWRDGMGTPAGSNGRYQPSLTGLPCHWD